MCNCGNKRDQFTSQTSGSAAPAEPIQTPAQKMWPDVNFIYTGHSALSVTGTVTGKQYRFNWTGDKKPVDYRDASSMMTVPVLKRVV